MSVCSRSSCPRLAQCIKLVDEHDAGGLCLGLLEHVADPRGTHAYEHLDEVGSRNAEEGNTGLAGDDLRQECLSGSRGTHQQHTPGDPPAQDPVLLGRLEEIDDFTEFFHRFVDPGHVVEVDADVFLGKQLSSTAAECHRRPGAPHAAHHHEEQQDQQRRQEEHRQEVYPTAARSLSLNVDPGFPGPLGQCIVVVRQSQPWCVEGDARLGFFVLRARIDGLGDLARDLLRAELHVGQFRVPDLPRLVLGAQFDLDRGFLIGALGTCGHLVDQILQFSVGDLHPVAGPQEPDQNEGAHAENQHVQHEVVARRVGLALGCSTIGVGLFVLLHRRVAFPFFRTFRLSGVFTPFPAQRWFRAVPGSAVVSRRRNLRTISIIPDICPGGKW